MSLYGGMRMREMSRKKLGRFEAHKQRRIREQRERDINWICNKQDILKDVYIEYGLIKEKKQQPIVSTHNKKSSCVKCRQHFPKNKLFSNHRGRFCKECYECTFGVKIDE